MSKTFQRMQNAVCAKSTGCETRSGRTDYYDTVGHAVGAVDAALLDFDCRIDPDDWAWKSNGADFSDRRVSVECSDGAGSHVCDVVMSFYRMQSGRYELTVYLA